MHCSRGRFDSLHWVQRCGYGSFMRHTNASFPQPTPVCGQRVQRELWQRSCFLMIDVGLTAGIPISVSSSSFEDSCWFDLPRSLTAKTPLILNLTYVFVQTADCPLHYKSTFAYRIPSQVFSVIVSVWKRQRIYGNLTVYFLIE